MHVVGPSHLLLWIQFVDDLCTFAGNVCITSLLGCLHSVKSLQRGFVLPAMSAFPLLNYTAHQTSRHACICFKIFDIWQDNLMNKIRPNNLTFLYIHFIFYKLKLKYFTFIVFNFMAHFSRETFTCVIVQLSIIS